MDNIHRNKFTIASRIWLAHCLMRGFQATVNQQKAKTFKIIVYKLEVKREKTKNK